MQCVRVILPGTTTLNSWPNIVSLLWRPTWLAWLVDGATRRLGDYWSLGRSMSGPALGAFHFELYLLKCSPRSGKMETLNSVGATTIKLMASAWTWAGAGGGTQLNATPRPTTYTWLNQHCRLHWRKHGAARRFRSTPTKLHAIVNAYLLSGRAVGGGRDFNDDFLGA